MVVKIGDTFILKSDSRIVVRVIKKTNDHYTTVLDKDVYNASGKVKIASIGNAWDSAIPYDALIQMYKKVGEKRTSPSWL